MKKIMPILVLVILLRPVLPVVEYVINYDYITTVLCVNKDKPKLACNGKCHLMKEMAKAAEEEKPLQKDTKQVKIENEVLFFSFDLDYSLPVILYSYLSKNLVFYNELYRFLKEITIFHPPLGA